MRLLLVIASLFLFSAGAATQENSFEKSFQSFGKKLDQAKAQGKQLGKDAKKEWKEIQAKTDKATDELAEKTEAKGKDWKARLKGAFSELGAGMKNAWNKLKGES
jgi:F0F1-type ATP synthase membrane subunit b/b'